MVISSNTSLESIKTQILNTLNVSVLNIKKYGDYKDKILDKEYEYLDIVPKNTSKGKALEILADYLKIDKNEILAIGDNLNDLDMVQDAGVGIAVKNAYNELKKVAKFTTTMPVEKGGFAEAIYKFISF